MPVKRDPSGRRYVEAEVEVSGTPEEVWEAIATGPGISSWFVPSNVEEHEGGAIVSHFSPDGSMDSLSTITGWDPPRRFSADSRDDMGPDDPTIATEWIVEAHSGGTCTVRVVHSWFTSKDDWDHQFEIHTMGWIAFFRILRVYLAHFRGLPCAPFQLMGISAGPRSKAWRALTGPLGLAKVAVGDRVKAPVDAPPLAGVVESVGQSRWPELLLRLDEPAPGIAHLFPLSMGRQVFLTIRFFLYGEESAAAAPHAESTWQAWIGNHFAAVGGATEDTVLPS